MLSHFIFLLFFNFAVKLNASFVNEEILRPQAPSSNRPNFVLFFADDIGWGDFGANWKPNEGVTPNLNQLAKHGLRLTDFHAGASVCTPSRASLLTGRLGLRTGVIKNFAEQSTAGLPLNETTLAEVLQKNGYHTGMIGKWHLGITKKYHPRSRGFDFYYGLPYSDDMGCLDVPCYNLPPQHMCPKKNDSNPSNLDIPVPLYDDYNIVEQPVDLINLGDHYGNKSEEFLKSVVDSPNPFFLYIAFAHMHVPLAHAPRFKNSTSLNTIYSDTLHEMDDIIGRVMSTLKAHNKYKNTVTWFTGDNGPWVQKCQFSGSPGPFLGAWQVNNYGGSTAKTTTWEAGHREPTVVVWPEQIAPNQVSDALTSALDVFPTFLSLAGIDLPQWRKYDGMDLSQFLKGKSKTAHSVLFHPNSGDTSPIGEIDAVRVGPYKVYWKTGGVTSSCDGSVAPLLKHDPPLVFDVAHDPAESKLLSPETFPNYNQILLEATKLRQDLFESIKSDNTSVADYSTSPSAAPCCDPNVYICRCKKD